MTGKRIIAYSLVALSVVFITWSCGCDKASNGDNVQSEAPPQTDPFNKTKKEAPPNDTVFAKGKIEQIAGLVFHEAVRGNAKIEDRLPLVVSLHGQGDKPDTSQFSDFGFPVRVVWPQAATPHEGGYQWFPFMTMEQPTPTLDLDIEHATVNVARFIKEYMKLRPTKGLPVIVGFSQGGMISLAMAVKFPDRIAAVHPISANLPSKLWPSLGSVDGKAPNDHLPRIRALHGTNDIIVAILPTQTTLKEMRASGYDVTSYEFDGVGHELTIEMGNILAVQLVESVRAAIAAQ